MFVQGKDEQFQSSTARYVIYFNRSQQTV